MADKKKKNIVTITGIVLIILITAGVFSYEASTIPVKKLETGGETTTTTHATVSEQTNETGDYEFDADKTVKGSCRNPDTVTAQILELYDDTPFPVREGAKRAIITASADVDIDLRIYDPNGDRADDNEGVTVETTETVTLTAQQLSEGSWTARVNKYSIVSNPVGETDYHITIFVYY